ncbi:AAA family ATPase [Halorubrum sp. Hd13]|uniref:AAA family ATPase n=1 Tax=Halorubrum sp. Hd13 TaxID=1480728 RepID=UPI000B9998B3|nr:AAA family ATPase [Halorubrum sp. Hd13]OYR45099.1 AAA family ATPase [Halorubrum sp. Hd13]
MSVRLPVADAPESVGDRRAGFSATVLTELGVEPGDPVSVRGGRTTVAVAARVDGDPGGACLPGSIRRNAGAEVGDTVTVEPVDAVAASAVTLRLDERMDLTRAGAALRRRLDGTAVSVGDEVEATLLGGALNLTFVVEDVAPSSPGIASEETEIEVETGEGTAAVVSEPSVSATDSVVPAETFRELREAAATRLDGRESFAAAGRPTTLGLLLRGPRGAGKTTLVEAVAAAVDATLVRASAARLRGEGAGDRERRLDRVVEAASDADRAVVLLDDLEVLGDDGAAATLGDRLRETLDELRAADGTVAIGVTTDAERVPEALRRGGRFDREVEVAPLSVADRREALESVARDVPLAMDVDFAETATRINGFVLADVTVLVDVALERAIRRDGRTAVRQSDVDHAMDVVEPSGLRDVAVEFPSVAWDDVGGLEAAKREIVRAVYWPLEYADRFERAGIEPPSGVLLYGPPGTGKTLLARAAASLSDANFISVNGPELLDRYVGASEQAVRDLFATARENAPAVVFFDEVDAISPKRRSDDTGAGERVVSQLLTELDGLEPLTDVVVVAATNRPDMIDEALLRPGRIEKTVETPLPDEPARREILRIHARDTPTAETVDFDALAERTAGYSGGDLAALVREAAMLAIEDTITDDGRNGDLTVDADHFERALAETTPSVGDAPDRDGAFQR